MKRKRIVALAVFGLVSFGLGAGPVKIRSGAVEIVVAKDAPPSVTLAAEEMTNFLSQTLGGPVPLVCTPTAGRTPVFLGAGFWPEPGMDFDALPTDGFAIFSGDGKVVIAGRDDARPRSDPRAKIRSPAWGSHRFDHGTLNGVYEFLERVAGVRFYFPGELGTCVARKSGLTLPPGKVVKSPDLTIRSWQYYADGEWCEGDDPNRRFHPMKALNSFRLRGSTRDLSCCHGLNGFRYPARFGKTHPEYFALGKDGKRMISGSGWQYGHLCLTSGIREEIFRDCLSYLKGEDASVRGIPGPYADKSWGKKWDWNYNVSPACIDLMPQDGHARCYCERCEAVMRKDGRKYPATELVWGWSRRFRRGSGRRASARSSR